MLSTFPDWNHAKAFQTAVYLCLWASIFFGELQFVFPVLRHLIDCGCTAQKHTGDKYFQKQFTQTEIHVTVPGIFCCRHACSLPYECTFLWILGLLICRVGATNTVFFQLFVTVGLLICPLESWYPAPFCARMDVGKKHWLACKEFQDSRLCCGIWATPCVWFFTIYHRNNNIKVRYISYDVYYQ